MTVPMRGGTARNLERRTDGAIVARFAELLGTPLLLVLLRHAGIGGLIAAITCCYLLAILCHGWMAHRRAAEV